MQERALISSMPPTLTAKDAFSALAHGVRSLDVRSQKEFAQGAFPGAVNLPILNDEHRHLVGLCYNLKGQEAAIKLGLSLVEPHKEALVHSWSILFQDVERPMVYCWRGGLRSRFACAWMREAGLNATRVVGGYKAIRREALESLGRWENIYVVGGFTGSGKTRFLGHYSQAIDLERLAAHRGSAFGATRVAQPAQQLFENSIALEKATKKSLLLVEDESRAIGKLILPSSLHEGIKSAPMILIQDSLAARAQNIFEDYVEAPLRGGVGVDELQEILLGDCRKIQKKLGGAMYVRIEGLIRQAFERGDSQIHLEWIAELLSNYYDPLYRHSFNRRPRKVIFQGAPKECHAFVSRLISASGDSICH